MSGILTCVSCSSSDERVAALEKTMAALDSGRNDEVELRRQLAQVQKQLDKYQAVYGEKSTLPPDVNELSIQLQHKQEELDKLRLQEAQREQSESAMYSELDKLSAAWEALDRQVKSKVFDLSAMEERVVKLGVEVRPHFAGEFVGGLNMCIQRAKSENKFYAAMRDKEAVENERKHISRNLEKQSQLVERLLDSEKGLQSRFVR